MISGEKEALTPSDDSSTECRFIKAAMSHCFEHTDRRCCGCNKLDPDAEEPRREECQHPNRSIYAASGNREWTRYFSCPDCKATWTETETQPEEAPLASEECTHPDKQYTGAVYDGPAGRKTFLYYTCPDCEKKWKEEERDQEPRCEGCGHPEHSDFCRELTMPGSPGDADECGCLNDREPPLSSEEEEQAACCSNPHCTCERGCSCSPEEQAPEDNAACEDCLRGAHGPNAHRTPPPQPDRRPPFAVTYSVQGHLYEVALPGDATVRAVDGALVIQHHLGPVAGIVQVLPVISEESA